MALYVSRFPTLGHHGKLQCGDTRDEVSYTGRHQEHSSSTMSLRIARSFMPRIVVSIGRTRAMMNVNQVPRDAHRGKLLNS